MEIGRGVSAVFLFASLTFPAPAQTPSGEQILIANTFGQGDQSGVNLQMVGPSGQALGDLTARSPGVIDGMARFSPDGSKVAFSRQAGNATSLYVVDVGTRVETKFNTVLEPSMKVVDLAWSNAGDEIYYVNGGAGCLNSTSWPGSVARALFCPWENIDPHESVVGIKLFPTGTTVYINSGLSVGLEETLGVASKIYRYRPETGQAAMIYDGSAGALSQWLYNLALAPQAVNGVFAYWEGGDAYLVNYRNKQTIDILSPSADTCAMGSVFYSHTGATVTAQEIVPSAQKWQVNTFRIHSDGTRRKLLRTQAASSADCETVDALVAQAKDGARLVYAPTPRSAGALYVYNVVSRKQTQIALRAIYQDWFTPAAARKVRTIHVSLPR